MFDPKHLFWLAQIADIGTINKAAKELNVTQPTLTRAVQIMESQVGVKLLERSQSGVRPTKIGEKLVILGRMIQEHRLAAEDAINLWKEGLEKEVRIGVGPMLSISVMGKFFAEFMDDPPELALRVVCATAGRLIERLNQNELDVVLVPEQIVLFQEDLEQLKIFEDELAIFASRSHPLAQTNEPIGIDKLENQKWLSVGTLSGIYGSNADVLNLLGIKNVSSTISFTGDINMPLDILRNSHNLCILPRKLGVLSASESEIAPLKISKTLPQRNISLWWRKADRNKTDIELLKTKLETFFMKIQ